MTRSPDLYRILQVDPEAEPAVIRAAYLCLAKMHHPDAGDGTGERMVALNGAWAVLGDAERRAAYDRSRSREAESATGRPEPMAGGGAKTVPTQPPGTAHAGRPNGSNGSSGTTLDFGRYAGWTLDALVRGDPDYLEWLARAPIGTRYRAEIYALLAARRPVSPGAAGQARGRTRPSPRPRRTGGRTLPWRSRPQAER